MSTVGGAGEGLGEWGKLLGRKRQAGERGRLVCQGRGRGRMCLERGGGGKCGILEGRNKGLMGQRAMEMQKKTKRLF